MKEMEKAYSAAEVEEKWYSTWEDEGYFGADAKSEKPPFCVVMPPPNITGSLHMGHALDATLKDILIRWKRMKGFEALWVPGVDHAGISTQTVVERDLIKREGKRRTDYSREEFLKHVWEWKERNEQRIVMQLKKLGASCDWNRHRFTMDEGNNRAVRRMFKLLFDKGLICQGDYLVNWDPMTETAIADDEVEYEERQSFLWTFKYPLKGSSETISIATTRPETMLGDTAVAVSPEDPRYKHLIGKTIVLPLVEREIPVIADSYVDPEFGTGAVKITPAHDPNDYEMGLRHNLPQITMMTPDGKINEVGGEFAGMTMEEGRKAVVEAMKGRNLLEKVEPHLNRIGISYRSKATIEPYLSKQWFVKMEGFGKRLKELLERGEVTLIPKHWESTYMHWIDNLRDWCISRQLWWGHRIPVWTRGQEQVCGEGPPEGEGWEQDPDVLDTWFSSALWPFAALGWPDETPELKRFYPNSLMETGHDILFFWVARMLLAGDFAMGELPFKTVFLHGMIFGKSYWRVQEGGGITYVTPEERKRFEAGEKPPKEVHARWEKMSKSKGNIIDPLDVIEEFGTDALRMAFCSSSPQAREIDLDIRRFEEFRNFANKVWNGARFVFMNLDLTAECFAKGLDLSLLTLEDRWILAEMNRTIVEVENHLEHYTFDQAAMTAYTFYWDQFCAYYVECCKPVLFGKRGDAALRENKQRLLAILLCQAIRLLHPMAPFITEELFSHLKEKFGSLSPAGDPYTKEMLTAITFSACIVAPYPRVLQEWESEEQFPLLKRLVATVRNMRQEMGIPPAIATDLHLIAEIPLSEEALAILTALLKVKEVHQSTAEPTLPFAATGAIGSLKVILPLPEEMREKEQARLKKELERLTSQLERTRGQLSNENFLSRAPADLVAKHKAQLTSLEQEHASLTTKLLAL